MSRIIQFKRYGEAAIANTIGANGEIIFDLTNRVITVHDGVTPGGFAVQTDNTARNLANTASTRANAANVLAQSAFNQANAANVLAQSSFTKANSANVLAQNAYDYANTKTVSSLVNGAKSANLTSNGTLVLPSTTEFTGSAIKAGGASKRMYIYGEGNGGLSSLYWGVSTDTPTLGTAAEIKVSSTGADIFVNSSFGGQKRWLFDTDGRLTLPGSASTFDGSDADNWNTAYDWGNHASAGYATTVQSEASFTKANSANVLAQAAFNQANTSAQTVPQNAQTTNYTLQLSDAGKHIYYTQSSNTILYIPTTSNVAFSNGTTIMIISRTTSNANVTVSPNTGVSMYLAGNTTSASRNVTTYGMASLIQVAANTWFINGTGVS
jgi:hypothetical protein